MESIFNTFIYIGNYLLDTIFPEHCLGCKEKGNIICLKCEQGVRNAERETSRGIMAAYDYRDPLIKRTIWQLKYYRRPSLGNKLGKMLYESSIEEVSNIRIFTSGTPIIVIPVPLSPNRKKERGYNQAERIAVGFVNGVGEEIFELRKDIILKIINTLPQARITNRNKRLQNIRGAFKIQKPELVKNRTVIVIDDVTTTGGTITEIMNILKKSGAKKVVGFAVAH